MRDRERRHAGAQPVGHGVVVERHDRHVVGDPQAGLLQRLVGAEREPVVEADDGARPGVAAQQLVRRGPALRRRPVVAQVPRRGRQALGRQHLADAGEPLDARDGVGRHVVGARSGADEVDLAVAGVEQQAGRGAARGDLVGHDRGGPGGGRGQRVEQHGGHALERLGHGARAREHRGQHDAVDLPVLHRVDERALDRGVALGLADEQHEAEVARGLDGALDHVAGHLTGRDRVGHEAERARRALAQADRDDVGAVAELARRGAHAVLHGGGDAQLGAAAGQHEGGGRRRHPRGACDVRERHASAAHVVLQALVLPRILGVPRGAAARRRSRRRLLGSCPTRPLRRGRA